jgi:hypothetical protein
MIDIEFVGDRSLTGRIIKWGTMSDIDHVQFVLPDGHRLGASFGTGVAILPPPAPGDVVRRYVLDAPATVLDFALAQIGKPYDLGAVLAIALRVTCDRNWRRPDKWFCSELVAAACEAGGRALLDAHDLTVITPRDVALSPLLIPTR